MPVGLVRPRRLLVERPFGLICTTLPRIAGHVVVVTACRSELPNPGAVKAGVGDGRDAGRGDRLAVVSVGNRVNRAAVVPFWALTGLAVGVGRPRNGPVPPLMPGVTESPKQTWSG